MPILDIYQGINGRWILTPRVMDRVLTVMACDDEVILLQERIETVSTGR